MISEDALRAFADEYIHGSEAEREVLTRDMIARMSEPGAESMPVRMVLIMRDRGQMGEAEQFSQPFLAIESLRSSLLFELAYGFSIIGLPERSVVYLDEGLREGRVSGHRLLFAARQYARVGDNATASRLLDMAVAEEPALSKEAEVQRQFFDFLSFYGRSEADALLAELLPRFADKNTDEIESEIFHAIETGTPYLMLRLGDGEGACIRICRDDEAKYADYYKSNRAEFADIWFRDTGVLDDPAFIEALDEFNGVIGEADCLGGIYSAAIEHEYGLGSKRGIAWVVNTMRKVKALSERDPDWAQRTAVKSLTVHYDLLLSGALARLLKGRSFVGVVSCQDRLPAALQRTYGISDVEFHKVPGEQIHESTLGGAAVSGRHWPDRFHELCATLDKPMDRRGQLFLVAAGMLGKIYAGKLKKAGAVVLDIGAVADLWMGKITRTFPSLSPEISLVEDTDPFVVVDIGGLGGLDEDWTPHLEKVRPVVFEPNPPEADKIRDSLSKINRGLVVEKALSNWPERRTLHVTKSLGCTSLLRPSAKTLSRYSISPAFEVTHTVEVDCVRFDALVATGEVPVPHAVKIDVQGFEYNILEGFGDVLKQCLGVKVECHLYPIYEGQKLLHDIVALLERAGLYLRRVVPVEHFDGDVVEVDAWFTRNLADLDSTDRARVEKLAFLEHVWKLEPRRANFGPDQFK